jgi:hypothetical protein
VEGGSLRASVMSRMNRGFTSGAVKGSARLWLRRVRKGLPMGRPLGRLSNASREPLRWGCRTAKAAMRNLPQ